MTGRSVSTAAPQQLGDAHIVKRFDAVAMRRPEAIAVTSDNVRLTYRALDDASHRIAAALAARGIGRGNVVGIRVARGHHLVTALIGTLRAGAAYLPLDEALPAARLRDIVEEAKPPMVLGDGGGKGRPEGLENLEVLPIEDALTATGQPPVVAYRPEDVAYVIYTSGSTGRPKGVVVEHRNVASFSDGWNEALAPLGAQSTALFAGLAFDAAVADIFPTLLRGARLHVPLENPGRLDPDLLLDQLETAEVDLVIVPPSWLAMATPRRRRFPFAIVVAGETCPPALARRWAPFCRFVNGYGPTEGTVCATLAIDPQPVDGAVPIGFPLSHVRTDVVDDHLSPVPVGQAGELIISGNAVARGYLHRPDLTAARFGEYEDGRRYYRTGDYVRALADGQLVFCGRRDRQVKVRGFRVELGEIESVLCEHPSVRSAVAVLEHARVPRLVAHVIRAEPVDARDLLVWLRERLPPYMCPVDVRFASTWPRSSTGKVDRHLLAAIGREERLAPDTVPYETNGQ
jgi:glycopeptidolipid biosynthesis protein